MYRPLYLKSIFLDFVWRYDVRKVLHFTVPTHTLTLMIMYRPYVYIVWWYSCIILRPNLWNFVVDLIQSCTSTIGCACYKFQTYQPVAEA